MDMTHRERRTVFSLTPNAQQYPIKTYSEQDFPPNDNDPDKSVAIGETWVTTRSTTPAVRQARRFTLQNWMLHNYITGGLKEKMFYFWFNHFGLNFGKVQDSDMLWRYLNVIKVYSTWNFKRMIEHMHTDPAMLIFLDGTNSSKEAPNLNYAREVMELFTVGKGNYTEGDIVSLARMFTGWQANWVTAGSDFYEDVADKSQKEFSEHFENRKTSEFGPIALERIQLLLFVFQGRSTAAHIVEKLLSFFVGDPPHPTLEVTRLADIFTKNDWEILPVLDALFEGDYFNSVSLNQIKSPVELVTGIARDFFIDVPSDPMKSYPVMNMLRKELADIGQDISEPPSVKGWPAYYQQPAYDNLWYDENSATVRARFLERLFDKYSFNWDDSWAYWIDVIHVANTLDAKYPDTVKDPMAFTSLAIEHCTGMKWSDTRTTELMIATLLSGQSEQRYWTTAWTLYKQNPQDSRQEAIVKERLTALFKAIVLSPEYEMK